MSVCAKGPSAAGGTHVLDSVSHARHGLLVAEIANVDIQGSTGFICLRVMNEQSLKLIV